MGHAHHMRNEDQRHVPACEIQHGAVRDLCGKTKAGIGGEVASRVHIGEHHLHAEVRKEGRVEWKQRVGRQGSGNADADIAGRNAGLAREAAATDAALLERQTRMQLGSIRAAYGASGVTAAGSPLDVLEMSVANAERDRQQILYKGELKALGYEDTRTLSLFGAESAKKQADFTSFSSLLTGVTRGAKLYTVGHTAPSAGAPVAIS